MLRDAPPLKPTSLSRYHAPLSRRPCQVSAVDERLAGCNHRSGLHKKSWQPWVRAGASAGTRSHHTASQETAPQTEGRAGVDNEQARGRAWSLCPPFLATELISQSPSVAAARCRRLWHQAGAGHETLLNQPSPPALPAAKHPLCHCVSSPPERGARVRPNPCFETPKKNMMRA